jgi:hypothetical protein
MNPGNRTLSVWVITQQKWARLLKQQSSFTVYRLATKETNFCFPFMFAANKGMIAVSVFRLQQTNRSRCFPLHSSYFRLQALMPSDPWVYTVVGTLKCSATVLKPQKKTFKELILKR